MVMQQDQRMTLRKAGQRVVEPLQLIVAQHPMRDTVNLAVEQHNLPLLTHQHLLVGIDVRCRQGVDHRGLKVVITGQPDTGAR